MTPVRALRSRILSMISTYFLRKAGAPTAPRAGPTGLGDALVTRRAAVRRSPPRAYARARIRCSPNLRGASGPPPLPRASSPRSIPGSQGAARPARPAASDFHSCAFSLSVFGSALALPERVEDAGAVPVEVAADEDGLVLGAIGGQ